jgi:hypothetical protein
MICDTENNMTDYLDDLLVKAGLEQQRKEIRRVMITDTERKVVPSKSPARIKVKIKSSQYDSVARFVSVSYKDETCDFDLETLQPTQDCTDNGIPKSIKKIMKHIRATLKQHKQELANIAYESKRVPLIFKRFKAEKNKVKY